MPSVVGESIWEITDKQLIGTNEVSNVYHYRVVPPTPTPTPAEVGIAWEATVGNTLALAQSAALTHTELSVEELDSLTNFLTTTSGVGAGAKAGEILGDHAAWEIIKRRLTKETRDGRVRIAGIVEADAGANFIAVASRTPTFTNVLTAMDTDLPVTGGTMQLVILRKTRDPITKEVLPYANWIYNTVAVVNSLWRITTQNSRKIW